MATTTVEISVADEITFPIQKYDLSCIRRLLSTIVDSFQLIKRWKTKDKREEND